MANLQDDEDERMSINVSMSSPGSAASAPCGPSGSSASSACAAPAGIMQPPSPVSRDQLQKRIESLQQQNRVLKCELETYKLRVKSLQEENKAIRQASVHIQAKAEQEEEFISNTLLKKIQSLKKREGVVGSELRARGGVLDQRPLSETQPAPQRKNSVGAHAGAGAGVPGKQVDETDRETRERDEHEAEQPGDTSEGEGRAG